MSNQLTYREKFTCEMIWGGIPTDTEYVRNSTLFQEGLKRFDSGEWKYFEKEEWKDIKGFEGYYKVSNHGRIKSVERYVYGVSKRVHKERVIKKILGTHGYFSVSLCKNKISKVYLVHRIVAEAFIKNSGEHKYINHINGDKTDSHCKNLEWVSNRENVSHAYVALKAKNKTSKYIGVHKTKKGKGWRAAIYNNKKLICIGSYSTESDAHNAYLKKMNELGIINKYIN